MFELLIVDLGLIGMCVWVSVINKWFMIQLQGMLQFGFSVQFQRARLGYEKTARERSLSLLLYFPLRGVASSLRHSRVADPLREPSRMALPLMDRLLRTMI